MAVAGPVTSCPSVFCAVRVQIEERGATCFSFILVPPTFPTGFVLLV